MGGGCLHLSPSPQAGNLQGFKGHEVPQCLTFQFSFPLFSRLLSYKNSFIKGQSNDLSVPKSGFRLQMHLGLTVALLLTDLTPTLWGAAMRKQCRRLVFAELKHIAKLARRACSSVALSLGDVESPWDRATMELRSLQCQQRKTSQDVIRTGNGEHC